MRPTHEPWLVMLSLLMAFQGSYVGLHLARQIGLAQGLQRRAFITMSALSMASAIWTMHFVGMLAVRLPMAIDFLVLPTLLSFLICVLVVGFAVFAVGTGTPSPQRIAFAAIFMGGGIVTMHYLGMYALHSSVHMMHDPLFVAASIVIGVAASGLSLWLGFVQGTWRSTIASATLMALAISAMHYTAMAGLTLMPHETVQTDAPKLSQGLLAIIVSVVAFVVSGLFLLTLIPGGRAAEPAPAPAPLPEAAPASAPADRPGEQERQEAGHETAPARMRALPVEKAGRRSHLAVAQLVAVQAQAHYTLLFDGTATWFCPLSISDVEAKLDPAIFLRVHRSHIVNLDRLVFSHKTGLFETLSETPYKVPVSRARRASLRLQLDRRMDMAG
ncbi:MHYT domain-containing protein [Labrys monachus]|uniref:NO-binding membrane sensor protein with MHYT domain n=1 Tax=Labrys monachus TaxID=217067 RepID=A0ABU0F8S3_9HYPH|nr:MHYT domain-containing protein [Labrys monachus]MDQ0391017.1 NO-binding membrane sensor protein with MHYT domain [Labrys monachus]